MSKIHNLNPGRYAFIVQTTENPHWICEDYQPKLFHTTVNMVTKFLDWTPVETVQELNDALKPYEWFVWLVDNTQYCTDDHHEQTIYLVKDGHMNDETKTIKKLTRRITQSMNTRDKDTYIEGMSKAQHTRKCYGCGAQLSLVNDFSSEDRPGNYCSACFLKHKFKDPYIKGLAGLCPPPVEPLADPVNHPSHYTTGTIECIDAIEASMTEEEFRGYLKGCSVKYIWRYRHKGNAAQDLDKALWYLKRLRATLV